MNRTARPLAWILAPLLALVMSACPPPADADDDDDDATGSEPIPIPAVDDSQLKLEGIADPPMLLVEPQNPLSGGDVSITVDGPADAWITLTLAGEGCGTLAGNTGSPPLQVSGAAGTHGACRVDAVVQQQDGPGLWTPSRTLRVQASEPQLPPFDVLEGYWTEGPPPGIDDLAGATVSSVQGPAVFINGASIHWTGSVASSSQPRALIITTPGVDGHFVVPLSGAEERDFDFDFTMSFDRDVFDSLVGSAVNLSIRVLDALNHLGPPSDQSLQGTEVGRGDVQVGISWDTPTDVDLHVTEPGGETIYYGNTTSSTGGQLDLDSNPGCTIDGVNHENVFWPPGASPSGQYSVTVRMFNDCEEGGASGTITITHCGDDSPIISSFGLGGAGSEQNWTFDSACESRIKGRIRYEDFAITRQGLSATGAFLPSRYVTVQVVRADDLEVLAEGQTDSAGEFDIAFVNDGIPGVKIQVLAWSDHARAKQEVLTLASELYAWISEEVFDESQDDEIEGANLDIGKANDGGALNIFDLGLKARAKTVSGSGKDFEFTTFHWTAGQRPQGENASFYAEDGKIYVLGDPADDDSYDDFILGHEFGHLVLDKLSTDDSPALDHSSRDRVDPRLAWSEGWGTYFGTLVTGMTTYADTDATGMGVWYDLEDLPLDRPLGMDGDVMTGNLSEAIVAGVLLDLKDNTNELWDGVEQGEQAIWSVVTEYLHAGSPWFVDRGVAERDLIDFLDGWFCFGFGLEGADDTEGVRGIVRSIHELTYDFGRAECQ
jgi:hypothetical protein